MRKAKTPHCPPSERHERDGEQSHVCDLVCFILRLLFLLLAFFSQLSFLSCILRKCTNLQVMKNKEPFKGTYLLINAYK